jgi:hypothetical protein
VPVKARSIAAVHHSLNPAHEVLGAVYCSEDIIAAGLAMQGMGYAVPALTTLQCFTAGTVVSSIADSIIIGRGLGVRF